jgi:hypothetical protein
MACLNLQKSAHTPRGFPLALILALVSCLSGCAAANPPSPGGPNRNAPSYPILLTDEQGDRRQVALAAWGTLTREQGMATAPAPELQPVTATIAGLPPLPFTLSLPKVGEGVPMTEEETREALRRFINDNHELLGIDPQQLSLVQRVDAADGTKRARYEQRPFRYPFRNGFGVVEISFTPDRRVLNISSTAIPEIERLRIAGAGTTPRAELATPELVIKSLTGRTITYREGSARDAVYTITTQNRMTPRQFVIFPRLREGDQPALEFHLAWEITIEGAPVRTIYLDAITNEIIGTTAANASSD